MDFSNDQYVVDLTMNPKELRNCNNYPETAAMMSNYMLPENTICMNRNPALMDPMIDRSIRPPLDARSMQLNSMHIPFQTMHQPVACIPPPAVNISAANGNNGVVRKGASESFTVSMPSSQMLMMFFFIIIVFVAFYMIRSIEDIKNILSQKLGKNNA